MWLGDATCSREAEDTTGTYDVTNHASYQFLVSCGFNACSWSYSVVPPCCLEGVSDVINNILLALSATHPKKSRNWNMLAFGVRGSVGSE